MQKRSDTSDFADGVLVPNAAAYPPDEAQAGLTFGLDRRFARWERADAANLEPSGDRLAGNVIVDHGTGMWPVSLDLARKGNAYTGLWRRAIPALPEPRKVEGTIVGKGPSKQRIIYTPWIKDRPWTVLGDNPSGTTTWVIDLQGMFPPKRSDKPSDFRLYLDHDGKGFTRCLGTAFATNTAWHEGDGKGLTLKDGGIKGRLELCLNPDRFVSLSPKGGSIGAVIDLDLTSNGDVLSGTYRGTVGVAVQWTGSVTGSIVPME